jgi:diaminohydroxyphosphoribosylaminopyrimidine deaminase/5-amino-6-(5-phosphoribosylamino)uracil reductase
LHYGKTPPCSILIKNLGFKRVVIGALDIDNKAKGGANYLKQEGLEVLISIKEKEALELIEPFIFWSKKRFIFFKLAQTLNGVIKGGTISSSKSREYVHKLRDKVDLLVIGGNTVRVDRPILDARMVEGRAPDILVYSKKKIDTNLPLFGVKGRKIFVEDNFDIINDYKYVMIEGGEGMLRATKDLVNWYLWFLAPFALEKESYKFNKSVNFLKVLSIDRDLMIWSKNG